MPRREGTDVYRFSIRGAGRLATELDRRARGIQDELVRVLRRCGAEAQAVFVDHAPVDTEQLRENIEVVPYFRVRNPRVSIRVAPLRGHGGDERDYLEATRTGHRGSAPIRPVQARALAVHYEGHRNPHIVAYRSSVRRAYVQPTPDWVRDAGEDVDSVLDRAERNLGRQVRRRVFGARGGGQRVRR